MIASPPTFTLRLTPAERDWLLTVMEREVHNLTVELPEMESLVKEGFVAADSDLKEMQADLENATELRDALK